MMRTSKIWFIIMLLLIPFTLNACKTEDDAGNVILPRGFDLQNTEWEAPESRVLRFVDYSIATYRNSGNSYVLSYSQSGNDVVFTISGNSKPDWTGTVNESGTTFTLYKDSYVVTFHPKQ